MIWEGDVIMKSNLFKLLPLLLCVSLLMTLSGCASETDGVNKDGETEYTVSEPYAYPTVPGSEEWKSFGSHTQMIEACQVPEDILENMTTAALLETVLNYPLLIDVFNFEDESLGYDTLRENCNVLQAFLEREDAKTVFESYDIENVQIYYTQEDYAGVIAKEFYELIAEREFS